MVRGKTNRHPQNDKQPGMVKTTKKILMVKTTKANRQGQNEKNELA